MAVPAPVMGALAGADSYRIGRLRLPTVRAGMLLLLSASVNVCIDSASVWAPWAAFKKWLTTADYQRAHIPRDDIYRHLQHADSE
jgi:hypothetical protein